MTLSVKVTPKAKLNSVKKISDTEYHIKTAAVADKDKANQSVIKLLSKKLKLPKSKIVIIKGEKSRINILSFIWMLLFNFF